MGRARRPSRDGDPVPGAASRGALGRLALGLAVVLFGSAARGAMVEGVAPGTPIVAVQINRHDVFDLDDPSTSAWPYRWANALHILTREEFIRRLLLFKVGDVLDPVRLEETEIILRGTGFLNPVTISARPVPGGAEVIVDTRDQWTLAVNLSVGVEGDRQSATFGVSDDNVLGFGKSLFFEVTDDPERTSTTFRYRDITFLGTRWQLELDHRASTDGSADHFRFEYPFFSLSTPRAGGVEWSREESRKYLWSVGERRVEGDASTTDWEVYGGLRLPGGNVRINRLLVGAFSESASFRNWQSLYGAPYSQPQDRDLVGPELGWEHTTFRWKVVRGFRAWFRQEDLALGPNWKVVTGISLPLFGGDGARLRYKAAFDAGQLSGRVYTWQRIDLSGRVEKRGLANAISHFELGGAVTGTAGLRGRVAADLGYALDGERQLTLGADTGLRGYDPNTFDGTSRVVANVEWRRRLTGEVLSLAALGFAVFADCGKTWGERVGPSTEGWRSDVGAGLLVELTRTSGVRVVRFEMAFPDRGGGPVYLITTEALF